MNDLRLAVVGAAGRMGRMLVQTIPDTLGVCLSGALESAKSPALGRDSGTVTGAEPNGVVIGADAEAVLGGCDVLIDFSSPASTVALAALTGAACGSRMSSAPPGSPTRIWPPSQRRPRRPWWCAPAI